KELIAKGNQVAYVGDVVGTGSSRKSATNSVKAEFGRLYQQQDCAWYGQSGSRD
ncbi:MAG: hypothetical protein CL490_13335, partial [Acinetobacter sp.]|nr:hypothetical protein [Acinetobacter sp.]